MNELPPRGLVPGCLLRLPARRIGGSARSAPDPCFTLQYLSKFRITLGTPMHFVAPIRTDFPYHSVCLQNLCRESESSVSRRIDLSQAGPEPGTSLI